MKGLETEKNGKSIFIAVLLKRRNVLVFYFGRHRKFNLT